MKNDIEQIVSTGQCVANLVCKDDGTGKTIGDSPLGFPYLPKGTSKAYV